MYIQGRLTENNIKLRPVSIFDSRFIHSGFGSYDFLTANGLKQPITSSQFLTWWWIKKRFVFSYCILVKGKRAGFLGLHNMQPCLTAEISLALFEKDIRRKGYGSRAFRLFADDLQKHNFVKKIVVRVTKDNFVSRSFWEKLGFEEVKRNDGAIVLQYAAYPPCVLNLKDFPELL